MGRYTEFRRRDRQQFAGKEIFEVKPIILGGSPTDPANKALLTRQQHIEAGTRSLMMCESSRHRSDITSGQEGVSQGRKGSGGIS